MSSAVTDYSTTIHADLTWCLSQARAQVVRPISQWVEDELIIPNGPFRGERFRHRRHPASRLWFEAIDRREWNRFAATGPTQNGKTLMCYVAPIMYHLFELRETVIIGLPTMAMAQDKWMEDMLPAIEASRYADLLPLKGEGSRGGQVKRAITFRNGVNLRFMSGGGGDKQRAGYTGRVLAVTETDGMDEPGETSREADKIEQLEGRTMAYGANKRVYLECTVSIETGRIWQEISQGTDSRIARPCPHCHVYVTPEREHLIGWADAETELEAAEKATWSCPACAMPWTEKQRVEAAEHAVLVHRGQKVQKNGRVVGDLPQTKTLGFRWSAIDNPFATAADLGAEEWRARHSHDRDNADKKMLQFRWATPYAPPTVELTALDPDDLARRKHTWKKGAIPDDCVCVSAGVDTGKHRLHWVVLAFRSSGSVSVIEYGEQPTRSKDVGIVRGLRDALAELRGYFLGGWRDATGKAWSPAQVWIDSGYHEHKIPVYEFCRMANEGLQVGQEVYRPTKGYGEAQRGMTPYRAPTQKGDIVRYIGAEFDFRWQRAERILLVHANSDYWKSQVHQAMAMADEEPGSIQLYDAPSPDEHFNYAAHITAEVQREEFVPGRGEVIVFRRVKRENHYLDATYLGLAAGNFALAEMERQRNESKRKSWFSQPSKPEPRSRPAAAASRSTPGAAVADGWESS